MSNLIQSEETFIKFIEGFKDESGKVKYEHALNEMAVKREMSLIVDFKDLYSFDPEFAKEVLVRPSFHLTQLNIAAFSKLRLRDYEYSDQIKHVNVRFRDLPIETPLRGIGAKDIGHLVMLKGIVVRAMEIKPHLTRSAFRCTSCGEMIILEQTDQFLRIPKECPSCSRKRGFDLVTEESSYIDFQQIFVSGTEEEMGEFCVEIFDDIVGTSEPGDHVIITGVVGVRHLNKTVEATLYIKGNHLEIERKAEIYTQEPSLQAELQKVLGVISEMERITGVVKDEDLFEALMQDHDVGRAEAARLIGVLMRNGTIYSPRPGYYKKTS